MNKDYPEEKKENNKNYSRKIKADIFIDDRNIGGMLDWGTIYHILHDKKSLTEIMRENFRSNISDFDKTKKKGWWPF